jgi:hypothetical protein
MWSSARNEEREKRLARIRRTALVTQGETRPARPWKGHPKTFRSKYGVFSTVTQRVRQFASQPVDDALIWGIGRGWMSCVYRFPPDQMSALMRNGRPLWKRLLAAAFLSLEDCDLSLLCRVPLKANQLLRVLCNQAFFSLTQGGTSSQPSQS